MKLNNKQKFFMQDNQFGIICGHFLGKLRLIIYTLLQEAKIFSKIDYSDKQIRLPNNETMSILTLLQIDFLETGFKKK